MGCGFDIYHKYAFKLPPRGQISAVPSNNAQKFCHPGYPRLSRSSGIGAPMRINAIWISQCPLGLVYKE